MPTGFRVGAAVRLGLEGLVGWEDLVFSSAGGMVSLVLAVHEEGGRER